MPTLTLPSGKTSNGLPLGIQIITRAGADEHLLAWGSQLEPILEYDSIHGLSDFLKQYS
jgi:Asp-tRNA(Asn)/Glu-tRNA(Gln) amidotransferase A subunit family amidase